MPSLYVLMVPHLQTDTGIKEKTSWVKEKLFWKTECVFVLRLWDKKQRTFLICMCVSFIIFRIHGHETFHGHDLHTWLSYVMQADSRRNYLFTLLLNCRNYCHRMESNPKSHQNSVHRMKSISERFWKDFRTVFKTPCF